MWLFSPMLVTTVMMNTGLAAWAESFVTKDPYNSFHCLLTNMGATLPREQETTNSIWNRDSCGSVSLHAVERMLWEPEVLGLRWQWRDHFFSQRFIWELHSWFVCWILCGMWGTRPLIHLACNGPFEKQYCRSSIEEQHQCCFLWKCYRCVCRGQSFSVRPAHKVKWGWGNRPCDTPNFQKKTALMPCVWKGLHYNVTVVWDSTLSLQMHGDDMQLPLKVGGRVGSSHFVSALTHRRPLLPPLAWNNNESFSLWPWTASTLWLNSFSLKQALWHAKVPKRRSRADALCMEGFAL